MKLDALCSRRTAGWRAGLRLPVLAPFRSLPSGLSACRCVLPACRASHRPADEQPLDHPELQEGPAEVLQFPATWRTMSLSSEDEAQMPDGDTPLAHGIMGALQRSPHWSTSSKPAVDLLESGLSGLSADINQVYIIAFTSPDEEREGVYSLRTLNPDGLPQDTIIGFESEQDAERYACFLEVTMEPHVPRVAGLAPVDLASFCRDRGYRCLVERPGSLVVPPDASVDVTDWERGKKLRRGQFQVLDQDSYESIRRSSNL